MIGGAAGFAARYPQVWHVIEAEGAGYDTLYPAETIRRLCGLPADSANREAFQRLDLPGGAQAILRLQLMPNDRLGPTLAGAFSGRPDLWRAHIDRHVFFWVAEDRRDRFLRACVRARARGAAGGVPAPVVIAVDTALLLETHGETAFYSKITRVRQSAAAPERGGTRPACVQFTPGVENALWSWRFVDRCNSCLWPSRGPLRKRSRRRVLRC